MELTNGSSIQVGKPRSEDALRGCEVIEENCLLWINGHNFSGRFILATTHSAFDHARLSFAATLVVRFEEWIALGLGLQAVEGVERQQRLVEALNFFADKQGVARMAFTKELHA